MRLVIRVMRRHDLTKNKITLTHKKTKTNTFENTFTNITKPRSKTNT